MSRNTTCVECGDPLTGRQTVVCSTKCRVRRQNNSPAMRNARARWRAKQPPKMCDWCGNNPRRPSSNYCSDRCALKVPAGTSQALVHVGRAISIRREQSEPDIQRLWVQGNCLRCGRAFTSLKWCNQRWCSRRCKSLSKGDLRRARDAGSSEVEHVARWRIFANYDYRCHLCAVFIDMELPAEDPMGPTIDHVVPLVQLGPHIEANLRPAHRMCNSLKSIDDCGMPY